MKVNKKLIAIGVCIAGAAGLAAFQAAPHPPQLNQQIAGRDLNLEPLRVNSATLTFQSENAATANISTAERGATPIRMIVNNVPATFAPAANGMLQGQLQASLTELKAENSRVAGMKDADIPIFEGRTQIGVKKASSFVIPQDRLRPGVPIPINIVGNPANISVGHSLMINDPKVTQDPTRTRAGCATGSLGPWSFGHIMNQMANQPLTGISGSELSRRWLQRWQFPQAVNDQISNPRPAVVTLILNKWQTISGGPANPLDMSKAPFRLLAIVNRVDLRKSANYGGGDAGEARFVFGAVDPQTCQPLQMTVIFEYAISKKLCADVKAWAKRWKDLDQFPIGSPQYLAALQIITDEFTKANANPAKPNGSALGQLRTNEILTGPWQLREFQLSTANGGHLEQVTVKQTPADGLDKSPTLATWVANNAAAIKASKHVVPLQFPSGTPFRAPHSNVPSTPANWAWDQGTGGKTIMDKDARHAFSLNTCNGCHGGEAPTLPFKHVDIAAFGPSAAPLSKFLTGEPAFADPVYGSPSRQFGDLKRRAADLDALINSPCFTHTFMNQMTNAH